MTTTLEIDGKKFHTIKSVADKVSYSRDYITRLAREEKILATNVGRQWFVDLDSLNNYIETTAQETEVRKKILSEERKREQKISTATQKKKNIRAQKAKTLNVRATVTACAVLTVGLLSGWATQNFFILNYPTNSLVANTFDVPDVATSLSSREIVKKENLSADIDSGLEKKEYPESTSNIRPISEDVENGILLLPQGSLTASPTEMFSDEVVVVTTEKGTQMIVRVDKDGLPVGNIIPFVSVPVNHSDR